MGRSVILGYHRIVEQVDLLARGIRTAPSTFRRHLEILARRFTIVPLDDLVARIGWSSSIDGLAAITFDDGYADNYLHAFPILSRLGLPATIFVTTDNVEHGRPFWTDRLAWVLWKATGKVITLPTELGGRLDLSAPEGARQSYRSVRNKLAAMNDPKRREQVLDMLGAPEPADSRPLTWEEIRHMHGRGIAFGSHTRSHPSLVALFGPALETEIAGSRNLIKARLGLAPAAFAYPFGHVDERVSQAVDAAGFSGGVTTQWPDRGTAWTPLLLPRLMVDNMAVPVLVSELDVLEGREAPAARRMASRIKAAIPRPVATVLRSVRRRWRGRDPL